MNNMFNTVVILIYVQITTKMVSLQKKIGALGKCNYDQLYVHRAVAAVRGGRLSMRQASEHYGVPYSTVQRRFHGKHPLKYGRQQVFGGAEEQRIKNTFEICAEWGFPLRSTDIRIIMQNYLNKLGKTETRFKENLPGIDWFKSFMKRHPQLTIKLAENTKRVRAGLKCTPSTVVNYDETNFADDPGSVKVVTKKGAKHTYRTIDTSKSSTTVMFAIAGDGTMLPPYVVYKAKHMYEGWTEGGLDGTRYNRSISGWFDSELFENWFGNMFLASFSEIGWPKSFSR
ncbi:hypothetical protein NQ317_003544 [Molorchus minor]|uniref:HTH CENPB-type domain-containing protein n=1 Tax=Molorchus minor TaxID=1323400 RepID=A0ABQ9IWY4_9CUCU|nr:hypothetical protein NQ317_003544 [Molorchus minor]